MVVCLASNEKQSDIKTFNILKHFFEASAGKRVGVASPSLSPLDFLNVHPPLGWILNTATARVGTGVGGR
jgi:hypothetical protein